MRTLAGAVASSFLVVSTYAATAEFPWKLERNYKFHWFQKDAKIGESLLRFEGTPPEAPAAYRLTLRRRLDTEGKSQVTRGDLRFRPDGRPVSYTEATQILFGTRSGLQELEVTFRENKVRSRYVNNGREESASVQEREVPAGTLLFATNALEHWAVFMHRVGDGKPHTLHFFYPEFAQVIAIRFEPEAGQESLEIGGKTVAARRVRFASELWKNYTGSVWIDSSGRLVQYASDTLRIRLEE